MPSAFTLADAASGWLLPSIAVLLGLATLAALGPRTRVTPPGLPLALSALACVGMLGLGLAVLVTGQPVIARAGSVLGFAVIDVRFDSLSALFLILLGAVGAASAIYGIGYTAHESPRPGRSAVAFPLFLASLALVFGSSDAFAFLLAWEVMALSSAALVVGTHPDAAVARAGYVYLAMTHLATAALIVGFAILATAAGSSSFPQFGAAAASLPPSRETRSSSWSWSASGPRPGRSRSTSGCRAPTRWRRRTCRR